MNNLKHICFMCLNNCEDFVDYNIENDTVHYVQYVLPELFIFESQIPRQICFNCKALLHSFYKFKKMCLKNDCRVRSSTKNEQKYIHICFMCLNSCEDFVDYNIENNDTVYYVQYVLPELFIFESQFPRQICFNCKALLHSFYKFKKMCLENTTRVTSSIKNEQKFSDVKHEKFVVSDNLSDNEQSMYEHESYNSNVRVKNSTLLLEEKDTEPHLTESDRKEEILTCAYDVDTFNCQKLKENEVASDNEQDCSPDIPSNNKKNNVYNVNDKLKQKNAECSICNKKFASKQYLKLHLKVHVGSTDIYCGTCKKYFATKANLRNHNMIFHTDKKDLQCSVCNKKFTLFSRLKLHLNIHTGVQKFECTVCNKPFVRKYDLKIHEKGHSDQKDFECTICEKKFVIKSRLKMHLKTHTSARRYQCSTCYKSFIFDFNLRKHMLIHGEKHFQCAVCDKQFSRKDNLAVHVKTHKITDTY